MKTKQAVELLGVSTPTLRKYAEQGLIRSKRISDRVVEYNEEDIRRLLQEDKKQKSFIYYRASSEESLEYVKEQMERISKYCEENGIEITKAYKDRADLLEYDGNSRKNLFKLLEAVSNGKVENIVVLNHNHIYPMLGEFFEAMFKRYNTKLIEIEPNENSVQAKLVEQMTSMLKKK